MTKTKHTTHKNTAAGKTLTLERRALHAAKRKVSASFNSDSNLAALAQELGAVLVK